MVSSACNGKALQAASGRVNGPAETQIIGAGKALIHRAQIARDGDFTDRIGDLAIFNPEARRATAAEVEKWRLAAAKAKAEKAKARKAVAK